MTRSVPLSLTGGAAPAGLRRMRMVATGLLIAMALLFLLTRLVAHHHPAWGFINAFAEAAMVGGLADWFAVTALFRHPLGLPIPHTAIVPRNKDRIGDTLAVFLRDNFLVARVVARRMGRVDVAAALGAFLTRPASEGRLWGGASRVAADILESLDPERFGPMVKGALGQRLRELNAAPLIGQAMQAAMADGRHLPLIDGAIRWVRRLLDANEHLIRGMVHDRSGSILRWTGLDETLSTKIINALHRLVAELAADPDHPLRQKIEDSLADLAHDLQHDPVMRDRIFALKAAVLDNPAVEHWWVGIWEQARAGMLKLVRHPDGVLAGQLGEVMRQLGATLQSDVRLRATVNRVARRAAVGMAVDYGDGIVRLVSDTVRGWDTATITGRLENAVGKDLQYIRVNGTLVGGLVGVLIHAIDVAL